MAYFYLATAAVLAIVGLFVPPPMPYVLTALQIFLFFKAFQRAQGEAMETSSSAG